MPKYLIESGSIKKVISAVNARKTNRFTVILGMLYFMQNDYAAFKLDFLPTGW
jgi:hypothetical protein